MTAAPVAVGLGSLGLAGLVGGPVALVLAVAAAVTLPAGGNPGTLGDQVPGAYQGPILAAAGACPGLPAPVLAAQLAAESGWNPNAVSPAGAQGIAQFMPTTWATWGRDANSDGHADPFDPADAIPAQGALMCALLGKATNTGWGDPISLALAGYNAGWGAVERYHGIPPYPETTHYVRTILAAADQYSGPPPAATGSVAAGGAVWPVDDPDPIRNGFGNRPAGISYELGYHTGVDFNADLRTGNDYGQPVRAARAGIVYTVQRGGPLGLQVIIAHPDGNYTAYAHLSSVSTGITKGTNVAAGQQIATIGCSGMTHCAPHLHFEVRATPAWAAGNFRDPLAWLGLGRP